MPMNDPPHVGAIIRGMIEEMDLSIAEASQALGVSRQTLDKLVNRRCGVTPEMALRLEAVFGSTADNWLRVQVAHELFQARRNQAEITRGLRKLQPV